MRSLLVEDDVLLGEGIYNGLVQYRYIVEWVKDGRSALEILTMRSESFDVCILDLGLPKVSGLDILRTIRQKGIDIPIIILTARESIEERVKGLDAGADDYLVKPFDLEELSARLRALSRRAKSRAQPTLSHGDIVLDPASHIVMYQDEPVLISRREFTLLQKLLETPGRVVSREKLNQTLYGWGESIDSNALEVHIHNLRKRFGSNVIRTIRGVGYMVDNQKSDVEAI